jgi:hypothetical protein
VGVAVQLVQVQERSVYQVVLGAVVAVGRPYLVRKMAELGYNLVAQMVAMVTQEAEPLGIIQPVLENLEEAVALAVLVLEDLKEPAKEGVLAVMVECFHSLLPIFNMDNTYPASEDIILLAEEAVQQEN